MTDSKGYGQFCPVAMTAQIFTMRWTPLIIRELLCAPARFSDLRKGVPRMSQSLLTRRLMELDDAGIVLRKPLDSGGYEYHLTEAGEALRPIVELMGVWGSQYLTHQINEDELDPNLLFWDMRRGVDPSLFPKDRRFVAHFEVSGVGKGQRLWWLVCHNGETDLCYRDPGHAVDLGIYASIRDLIEVWIGNKELRQFLREEKIRLEGSQSDKTLFNKWFMLSPFANEETNKRLSLSIV